MTVKQTHCGTLGKLSSPWEEYIHSVLCEHLLCANTVLGQRVTVMEIDMLISHPFPALTSMKVSANLMQISTYQCTNSYSFS